ncbi:MAG: glycerate kinase [Deltaproteobacteria bacterium]|nr:glycerate kinase [Deltaproteobacteria bacterium]
MKTQPRISALIAMSAFKGQLTNDQACTEVAEALRTLHIPSQTVPVADGGNGTLTAIHNRLGGACVKVESSGPLGAKVEADVLCLPNAEHPEFLFVESAQVCGHSLIPDTQRDAMRATSYGLGELLNTCSKRWSKVSKVYIGLGDSAISDAGMGMLSALGYAFVDNSGTKLWGNAHSLRNVTSIVPPKERIFRQSHFVVLCDVLNPLCGPKGSARTFAKQKGATLQQVELIEKGMMNYAQLVQKLNGRRLHDEPMTGSAGGLGAAFAAFFDAELVLGAQFLLDWIRFDNLLKEHSVVITGEGKTDQQTLQGKSPFECISRASRLGKPSLILSGSLGPGDEQLTIDKFQGCWSCGTTPTAAKALRAKTIEIFSDKKLLAKLG